MKNQLDIIIIYTVTQFIMRRQESLRGHLTTLKHPSAVDETCQWGPVGNSEKSEVLRRLLNAWILWVTHIVESWRVLWRCYTQKNCCTCAWISGPLCAFVHVDIVSPCFSAKWVRFNPTHSMSFLGRLYRLHRSEGTLRKGKASRWCSCENFFRYRFVLALFPQDPRLCIFANDSTIDDASTLQRRRLRRHGWSGHVVAVVEYAWGGKMLRAELSHHHVVGRR